jgi:hypothetical protein
MSTRQLQFKRISSDEDASFLMPGQQSPMTLVIFCGADAPVVQKARELSAELDVPEQWGFALVDPEAASETTRWFGIKDMPAMGAVCDGALLALEYECSLEAFERLIHVARQQYAQL